MRALLACVGVLLAVVSTSATAQTSSGTGFFVNSQGFMATNFHVVEGAKKLEVMMADGKTYPAEVVLTDPTNDLAIIKVQGVEAIPLPVKDSTGVRKGDAVFTVGFPRPSVQGRESKVTEGIISSLTGIANQPTIYQHSIPTQGGNSGGPIVDKTSGVVIGVIVSKLKGDQQLVNYGVKSGMLMNLISSIPSLTERPPSAPKKAVKNFSDLVAVVDKSVGLILVWDSKSAGATNTASSASSSESGGKSKFEVVAQAAANYDKGMAAIRESKFPDAMMYLGRSAEAGNDKAQAMLGALFEEGRVGAPDYPEAAKWYRQAAEQGNGNAQAWLGDLYRRGQGVQKDFDQAAAWYKKSVAQNNANGQLGYGLLFDAAGNLGEAVKWVRLSADNGNSAAQYTMGALYEGGKGVPQSRSDAIAWYTKSAEKNNAAAKSALQRINSTPASQPATAAAPTSNGGGKDDLDRGLTAYSKGNFDAALSAFRAASAAGNAAAQNMMGVMYAKGEGVAKSDTDAFNWYKLAAEGGNPNAQGNLASRYLSGVGAAKDPVRGYMWAILGAEKGSKNGQSIVENMKKLPNEMQNTYNAFADDCRKKAFRSCGPN